MLEPDLFISHIQKAQKAITRFAGKLEQLEQKSHDEPLKGSDKDFTLFSFNYRFIFLKKTLESSLKCNGTDAVFSGREKFRSSNRVNRYDGYPSSEKVLSDLNFFSSELLKEIE